METQEIKEEQKTLTVRELAKAYVPKKTKVISDLDVFDIDLVSGETTAMDDDSKEFSYHFITIDGEEYRIPNSVLKNLKVILEAKPDTKKVQVIKTGEGFKTRYTVIPL